MEFGIIKPVYNDIKYLFMRTKVFREKIEDERSKLSVYIGELITAVNYLSNLDMTSMDTFISLSQSTSSNVLDLKFISLDNNALYSGICSINDQLQNIEQKHKDVSCFFLDYNVNSKEFWSGSDYRDKFKNLKGIIKSTILPCAFLIKSINLYGNVRYGGNHLSKYHSDKLNDLIDKAEDEAKKNLTLLHESIDTITNTLQVKTIKEIRDKELPTKEVIKSWFYFLMFVASASSFWAYAPYWCTVIKGWLIQ